MGNRKLIANFCLVCCLYVIVAGVGLHMGGLPSSGSVDESVSSDFDSESVGDFAPSGELDFNNPLFAYQKPERINLKFPAKLPAYNPEINVFPLINAEYPFSVDGMLHFINRGYQLFDLPQEAEYYSNCYSSDNKLQCYELYSDHNNMAVMNLSGEIVTGFVYNPIYYYQSQPAFKGYLRVSKSVYDQSGAHKETLEGVIDIRTGKEIIPVSYNDVHLFDGYIYAKKGAKSQLLDYNEKVLYDFGATPVYFSSDTYQSGFNLDTENNILSRVRLSGDAVLKHHKKYVVFFDSNYSYNPASISVYSKNGEHLFSAKDCLYIEDKDQNIVIGCAEALKMFVVANNVVKSFPFYSAFSDYRYYKDDTLTYYTGDDTTGTIDHNGRMLSRQPDLPEESDVFDETYGELIRRYRHSDSEYALLNRKGEVLIPFGKFDWIRPIGSFVGVRRYASGKTTADIYNTGGKLVLADVYGYTAEIPGDGLIVYKSNTDCGILRLDGSFHPIDAPRVRRSYGYDGY